MEIRQIRYVLAVAEHRSVRGAAPALHLAQQSLSEQIQAVERELGVALFHRSRRGMSLTTAGEVFVAQATVAVDAVDQVAEATRAAGRTAPRGPLRIVVATGLGDVLGELLRLVLATRPDTDVRVADVRTTDQIELIRAGEASAGLAYGPLA